MHTLPALYKHCIFRSQDPAETHAVIAEELTDHNLKWSGGVVDTRAYKVETQRLALYSLQYGDEVEIYPETYPDFSLVHFSLRGSIEVAADGIGQHVRQCRAIVSSPTRNIHLRWSKSCEQLILRMPHAVLQEAADHLGQADHFRTLTGTPGLMLGEAASAHWLSQLHCMMSLDEYARSGPEYLPWLKHIEQSMAMFLLMQSRGNTTAQPGERTDTNAVRHHIQRRLERLEAFVAENLTSPVTLADMAKAAALSERQLNVLCNERFGVSPMIWLRQVRLDAIRRILSADRNVNIAATALLHGFDHLGRFASYYRSRFGELPSQTRNSAKNGS